MIISFGMPLYEYICEKCNQTIEVVQKFSDAPLDKCPHCEGPVKKSMSLGGFALKGNGWYTSDYKKPSSGSKE